MLFRSVSQSRYRRKALEAAKFVLDGCGVYIRKNEKSRLKYSFADASEMVDNALIHSV